MTKKTVAVVFGTRPEAIKLAAVIYALKKNPHFDSYTVSTGQHREMLAQVLSIFELQPDYDLHTMQPSQTLADSLANQVQALQKLFSEHRPDWVLVQGDTTTAFAGALAAFYAKAAVGHVEAGLRSGNRYSPFPEEIHRRLIDQLSNIHFAPTAHAARYLAAEGFPSSNIFVTGNTGIDALLMVRDRGFRDCPKLPGIPSEAWNCEKLIVVTAHRRENFGAGLDAICGALSTIADADPSVHIVYPVHLNPNVHGRVYELLKGHSRIHCIPPLDYRQFILLLTRAYLVLTDSGGLQEEVPALGKPVLVLRETTERPEGIEAGVAKLVGINKDAIVQETRTLLNDRAAYNRMAKSVNPYGDGHAAEQIVKILQASPDSI